MNRARLVKIVACVFFQVEQDGRVTRLKDPKLRPVFIQRFGEVAEEETKHARAAGRWP